MTAPCRSDPENSPMRDRHCGDPRSSKHTHDSGSREVDGSQRRIGRHRTCRVGATWVSRARVYSSERRPGETQTRKAPMGEVSASFVRSAAGQTRLLFQGRPGGDASGRSRRFRLPLSRTTGHSCSGAADCAEQALPYFEERYPQDDRPRKAVEAGRARARRELAVCPSVFGGERAPRGTSTEYDGRGVLSVSDRRRAPSARLAVGVPVRPVTTVPGRARRSPGTPTRSSPPSRPGSAGATVPWADGP